MIAGTCMFIHRDVLSHCINLTDGRDAGIEEVRARLVVAPADYIVKIVDKDGVRVLGRL